MAESDGGLGRPPASEKGGEEDKDDEEEDGEETERGRPRPLGSSEGGGDERSRRMIRNQYRELICSVQQNREDMLSSKSNRLTEALEEANQLFRGVSRAREAALDAQFLVLASNLVKEKANELRSEITTFDSVTFAEDVLTFMGINRTEVDGNSCDSENTSGGYLPSNAWYKLGEEAEKYFRRAPSFHYMLGSFKSEPPVPRQRIERQRKAPGGEEKRAMPAQLKKMEESHQEATAKEVERILRLLQTRFRNDPHTPIFFFDLVVDPNSFARTVENIFHVSFIVRDGLARLKLDADKLPVIVEKCCNFNTVVRRLAFPFQGIQFSFSQPINGIKTWWEIIKHSDPHGNLEKEIVETYEITEPMINHPNSSEDEMETA
ncbi:UNVERIFIED_CONTAM: hypothetical protein H355_005838 [Colinus virginianus]|nr:hypothetical protein H355_005838 [Colinus virginianus]